MYITLCVCVCVARSEWKCTEKGFTTLYAICLVMHDFMNADLDQAGALMVLNVSGWMGIKFAFFFLCDFHWWMCVELKKDGRFFFLYCYKDLESSYKGASLLNFIELILPIRWNLPNQNYIQPWHAKNQIFTSHLKSNKLFTYINKIYFQLFKKAHFHYSSSLSSFIFSCIVAT